MSRPTVICIDPYEDDLEILERTLESALLRPVCFASLWAGINAIGVRPVDFVLVDYSSGNHDAVVETVRLCHRHGFPVAVMVRPAEIPTPEEVEEIGCMWRKDTRFLEMLPELILGGTGLLPKRR